MSSSAASTRVFRLAINAADHLVGKRRLDAAASILENYLSAHAEHAEVLRRLGKIRLAQGKPDLAAPLFKRALAKYREQTRAEASPAAPVAATVAD